MFAKKGKRKIIVNDKRYYWTVIQQDDPTTHPFILHVFSDTRHLFQVYSDYGEKITTPFTLIYKGQPLQGHHTEYRAPPHITPGLVRKHILDHEHGALK